MALAHIVLARNDLPNNMLQVLDLKPNSSQFSPAYDGQDSGQTGYQTWFSRDAAVNSTVSTEVGAGGPASLRTSGVYYGLAAYLIANVEDQTAGAALTAAMANATRVALFARVAAGSSVTAADVAAAMVVAGAGAGTSLTFGTSTGSLAAVLRILAGEVWRLPTLTQVQVVAGTFDATAKGGFVIAPIIENPDSVEGTYGGVRGRKSTAPLPYIRPGELRAGAAPVQTGLHDLLYRAVRTIVDTGDLQLSALTGQLADLKSATYTWVNPAFTYAGGATPAQTIAAANIPATGIARGVVIYDALGNII